jgi:predicted MFS family arabinose efflux permease
MQRDMLLFIVTLSTVGLGDSVLNAVFNNFLDTTYDLNSFWRTFLELPRESGGLLVIIVSAALFFIRTRRLAVIATLCGAIGLTMMALFSQTFHLMFIWLFMFSLGQHLFMPLNTAIGMELAKEGKTGTMLGRLNAIRNLATITGSFLVYVGFKYLSFDFKISFLIASMFYLIGALTLFCMHPGYAHPAKTHLKLYKEYGMYYWLAILFGTRKQIFLTFAPWVLVTVFKQPTSMIAKLLTIAGIVGIAFQPLLGKAVDRLGERTVLACEAFFLIFICIGYGYSSQWFSKEIALIVAAACFIADQLLMSVNMARSTYLKKIAISKEHITPTLTMAVSIDHIFSISIALLGGVIWSKFGHQAVFLLGAVIALVNLVSAMMLRVPGAHTAKAV